MACCGDPLLKAFADLCRHRMIEGAREYGESYRQKNLPAELLQELADSICYPALAVAKHPTDAGVLDVARQIALHVEPLVKLTALLKQECARAEREAISDN
jgi:hypothetical protein